MLDITNATEVATATLQQLQTATTAKLKTLADDKHGLFAEHFMLSNNREQPQALLMEFRELFDSNVPEFALEFGFFYEWGSNEKAMYETRWWINEYPFGVYFIYDRHQVLRYVGSACGGSMGNRMWAKRHEEFRHSVDVVLFPKSIGHLALAFEPFVISKLSQGDFKRVDLTNKQFVALTF